MDCESYVSQKLNQGLSISELIFVSIEYSGKFFTFFPFQTSQNPDEVETVNTIESEVKSTNLGTALAPSA